MLDVGKLKCECGCTHWEFANPYHYDFIFQCVECGRTHEIISLVELQVICKTLHPWLYDEEVKKKS